MLRQQQRLRSFRAVFSVLLVVFCRVSAFVVNFRGHQTRKCGAVSNAQNNDDDNSDQKPGYKFGDLSKSLAKRAASRINKITGKDTYEFGDLSRHLDSKAKSVVSDLTGKEEYEFGDLSRYLDAQVKVKLTNFTGKEEYELGDVSKEILRRVATGEYTTQDILFLCKILVQFGVGLTPVANALPMKLLLQMLNISLLEEVGERVSGALARTLDERFKEAVTGDAQYKLGDKTRQAISEFTGKDTYSFGDISRAISARMDNKSRVGDGIGLAKNEQGGGDSIDPDVLTELEDFDRRLLESASATDKNQ